jgi:integrase
MSNYLSKRGSTYYFRRVIPEAIRSQLGGRKEIVFSLKTKDRKLAERQCRHEAVRIDALFMEAESALSSEVLSVAAAPSSLSVVQRAAVIANSWRREREIYAAKDQLPEFNQRVQEALSDHRAILRGDFPDAPPGSMASSEAMVIGSRAILTGEGVAYLPEVVPVAGKPELSGSSLTLTQLIDRWATEKKPTQKSILMWRRTCRDFDEFTGTLPTGDITKRHVLDFKDRMLGSGSSPATVNNRLNQLRSLFRYAMANDLLPADPANGVKAPVSTRAKEARLPFDAESLKALFSGPVHSAGARPKRGGGEAAYWLPLLALFTGARLNELGQLRTSDVLQERYFTAGTDAFAWVIRFTADESDGLRLKNQGSARRVPIHSTLVELGFLRYADKLRINGEAKLFPELKGDRFGTVTGNWGKWFGPYLRSQNVNNRKIVFHSFRHSFKHYARNSGIDKSVNDALTGHESGDVADNYGGPDYPLKPLIEGITMYRVPEFDTSSIIKCH